MAKQTYDQVASIFGQSLASYTAGSVSRIRGLYDPDETGEKCSQLYDRVHVLTTCKPL